MADTNGNNNRAFLATELGGLNFGQRESEPFTIPRISIRDSVETYGTISATTSTLGSDSADYFSFAPSGLSTVTVTANAATSGTFSSLLFLIPTSGVSEVSGDIVGTWYGGQHAFSKTKYTEATDAVAGGFVDEVSFNSRLYDADLLGATWARADRDGMNAVWTLDGSPVVFEIIGFQLNGDLGDGEIDAIHFDEIDYDIFIDPLDRAFADAAPGSLLFTDTAGVRETHRGRETTVDVFRFDGRRDEFAIVSIDGDRMVVRDNNENLFATAADTLISIERIQLDDGFLAFDTNGNAGQMYRLYQAAFDRDPDHAGLGHWINTFDKEVFDLVGVAEEFLMSEEFQTRFGTDETLDDNGYLTLLYNNVLDRTPDQAGFEFWSDQQENGISRADMLRYFSESVENYANVSDEIDMGIFYLL